MKSGRPKLKKSDKRVHITARVSPEVASWLESRAKSWKVSKGKIIDAVILREMER